MAFWGCCFTSSAKTHKDPFAQEDELRLTDLNSAWGKLYIMIWAAKEKNQVFYKYQTLKQFPWYAWQPADTSWAEEAATCCSDRSTWGHQLKAHRHLQEWNSAGTEQIPRQDPWTRVLTLSKLPSHSRQTWAQLHRLGWHQFSLSMDAFYVFSFSLKAGMRKNNSRIVKKKNWKSDILFVLYFCCWRHSYRDLIFERGQES